MKKRKKIVALLLAVAFVLMGINTATPIKTVDAAADSNFTLRARAYVQKEGWEKWLDKKVNPYYYGGRAWEEDSYSIGQAEYRYSISNYYTSMTHGVEGFQLQLKNKPLAGSIKYRGYIQKKGWLPWVAENEYTGTKGENIRLECIQIKLTGELAKNYSVWYRVFVKDYGWLNWNHDGGSAGTTGCKKPITRIEIALYHKDYLDAAEPDANYATTSSCTTPFPNNRSVAVFNWKEDFRTDGRRMPQISELRASRQTFAYKTTGGLTKKWASVGHYIVQEYVSEDVDIEVSRREDLIPTNYEHAWYARYYVRVQGHIGAHVMKIHFNKGDEFTDRDADILIMYGYAGSRQLAIAGEGCQYCDFVVKERLAPDSAEIVVEHVRSVHGGGCVRTVAYSSEPFPTELKFKYVEDFKYCYETGEKMYP